VGIEVCLSQTAVCKEGFPETGMVAGGKGPDLLRLVTLTSEAGKTIWASIGWK
jgi:hypothetical protein